MNRKDRDRGVEMRLTERTGKLVCIDNPEKNLLSSNISSTSPHNMVNFGQLAAEIVSLHIR